MVKKFFTITVPLALALVIALQFVSCEKYILPEMYLSQDTLAFGASSDSLAITVHSNVIWSFKNEDDGWVRGYPNWGDADSVVVFTVKANESPNPRSLTLNIKSETISRYLFITQEGSTGTVSSASSASPCRRRISYTSPTAQE